MILDGAVCNGVFSDRRLFCPRAIYPYWRTLWLKPLDVAQSPEPQPPQPLSSIVP